MSLILREHVGRALEERSEEITRRWLDQLRERLEEEPRRIFPTDLLLDHIPNVLTSVARSLAAGDDPGCKRKVRQELSNLARLRRNQGYSVQEILEEFDLFGNILFEAVHEHVDDFPEEVAPVELLDLSQRLYHALLSITTCTAEAFRDESYRDRKKRSQLLGSFGRALAHELRNRLHAAQAGLHLLRDTMNGEAAEILDLIHHSFQGIGSVADDVQALAVAQASEDTARGRQRPLPELLDHIVRELQTLARRSDVILEIEPPVPEVQVDATRVELILINLVGNAIKYTDERKDERWVRVSVEELPEAEAWCIAVADNGVGIPREMHAAVFQDFVRGRTTEQEGTGLGLAICREAVEQLGGRLWLESEPGEGSTFYFTVPKASAEPRD